MYLCELFNNDLFEMCLCFLIETAVDGFLEMSLFYFRQTDGNFIGTDRIEYIVVLNDGNAFLRKTFL